MDQHLKYQVHTFGCKVNTYDSGLIQKNLNQAGFVDSASEAPRIHVLNTCAVTAEATKEAVKVIRKLKVKDPFCTIVVTGCAAQVDTGSFENLPSVDLIVANSHKGLLPSLIDQHFKGTLESKVFKSNIFRKDDLEMGGGEESTHTRSFLKIQDGCNSFCTYCIIPYARGKSRSIPAEELVKRINSLYDTGVREVVLTGVHVGDYEDQYFGKNLNLESLLEVILERTKVPRFRLASLEPVEVTEKLLELHRQNPRLCPHFHMSIQSANTDVLANMKRKYTQAEVIHSLRRIKEVLPGAYIGMDVIVGFPTETKEQFEDTYLTLAELDWNRIHVFPYSVRQGTRAAIFSNKVTDKDKSLRAARLRELSAARMRETGLSQVGKTKKVLVLKSAAKGGHGLSQDYWPVEIKNVDPEILKSWAGQEIDVQISSFVHSQKHFDGHLQGEVVSSWI